MTTTPTDLARKQPAQIVTRKTTDDSRTIDGQWRATRGGLSGWSMFTFVVLLMLAGGLAGLVLSLIQQS